eukprot:7120605-Lingulodinium_polyedra.AAC.1
MDEILEDDAESPGELQVAPVHGLSSGESPKPALRHGRWASAPPAGGRDTQAKAPCRRSPA